MSSSVLLLGPPRTREPLTAGRVSTHGIRASARADREEEVHMLWLILGVVLLVVAIAGGAIVHPVLFVLGLVALFMFFSGWRGRTAGY